MIIELRPLLLLKRLALIEILLMFDQVMAISGASPCKFVWGWRGGWLCKSWTSYPGQYSGLSEGATKAKQLKVGNLIM